MYVKQETSLSSIKGIKKKEQGHQLILPLINSNYTTSRYTDTTGRGKSLLASLLERQCLYSGYRFGRMSAACSLESSVS